MAYSLPLAERTRQILEDREGLSEKKMFGGIAFLLNGKWSWTKCRTLSPSI